MREAQLAQAQAALPPARFAPFSPVAWTSGEYEGATACLRWPGPRKADPPVPPAAPYPRVPTLVLNGDLDNITASSGARVVAERFPRSTFVELRNSIHVTALGDLDDCAAPIARRFVETLDAGDTSCAERVKEVRTVDAFPLTAADAEPATSRAGDESRPVDRRVAAAPPPRSPTRSSAGRSTTAARAAACAAAAGATRATTTVVFTFDPHAVRRRRRGDRHGELGPRERRGRRRRAGRRPVAGERPRDRPLEHGRGASRRRRWAGR